MCAHDELVSVHALVPNPKNPNRHPRKQIKRLAALIEYQGQRHPVIVSKQSGFIVVGHGRLEAIQELGWEKCAVNYQDFESPAQEYAFVVSDNAIPEWAELDKAEIANAIIEMKSDLDLDMLGFEDFILPETDVLPPSGDEDAVPGVAPKIFVTLGDKFTLGKHSLMCGDSTNIEHVERLMGGQRASVCLTDPPYGISYQSNYRKEKFQVIENDDKVLSEWVGCAHAVTDSWVIFFIGWQRMSEWLEVGKQLGKLTNILVWRKSAAMGDLEGSFSPNYEMALAYNRGGKLVGGRPMAVIEQNIDRAEGFVHPTQKPVQLCEQILKHLPEGPVLDLFGGSGWSLITCEKVKRVSFTMEMDPAYCQVIIDRWQAYTGKKAVRHDGVVWDDIKKGNEV